MPVFAPWATITRWIGTLAVVIGVIWTARSLDVYPDNHGVVFGLATVGGGLLLRIEAAIRDLADRPATRPRERALPYGDAED
jgi:hypothetical protein